MQQTVCQWRRRLSVCVKAGGGHFEHYQSINRSLFYYHYNLNVVSVTAIFAVADDAKCFTLRPICFFCRATPHQNIVYERGLGFISNSSLANMWWPGLPAGHGRSCPDPS